MHRRGVRMGAPSRIGEQKHERKRPDAMLGNVRPFCAVFDCVLSMVVDSGRLMFSCPRARKPRQILSGFCFSSRRVLKTKGRTAVLLSGLFPFVVSTRPIVKSRRFRRA